MPPAAGAESRKKASETRLTISVSSTTPQLGSDTPLAR
jgi:hypothetical protein